MEMIAQARHPVRARIMAIVGASSGNLVEWYDFYAYAFAAIYFAHAFFPAGDTTAQLLNTAAVFAVGFLMRPLGGWLFGWMADRHGRRRSMIISVLMMSAGSAMIAMTPTYESIGIWAPILLVLARMLQGLSVGGEYGTAATYMSEVATQENRGFYASFQYVTLIGGQLLAVLVIVVLEAMLTHDELRGWGWRIPFVIGALAAIVALYLRRSLHETQSADVAARKEAGSLLALLRHPRPLLIVLALTAGGSLCFYTFTTYMQKYLVNTVGLPIATVSQLMAGVLLVFMVMQPLCGALSDRIGRKAMLLIWSVSGVLLTVPLLTAIGRSGTWQQAGLLVLCAMLMTSFYTSISGVVKAELFPAEVRALGVGLPYAVANAVFGGSAEYVALRFKAAGAESWFFFYVAGVIACAFFAILFMHEPRIHGHLAREEAARGMA
jgi:MHS family alpha-ketoglutarate permease-like MFS transporter